MMFCADYAQLLKTLSIVCMASAWGQGQPGGQQNHPGGPPNRGMGAQMSCPVTITSPPPSVMMERIAQTLQLTVDQLTNLKNASAAYEQALLPLTKKSKEATDLLRTAVIASDYDSAKANIFVTKALKAEEDVITANLDAWAQIRSILTADEMKSLKTILGQQRPGQGQRPGSTGQGQNANGTSATTQSDGNFQGGPPPSGDGGFPGGPPPDGGGFPGGPPPPAE